MNTNWKRDLVEEAQLVMNSNRSVENKNLISSLTNEIVAQRAEIERLETEILRMKVNHSKYGTTIPGWPTPTMKITFNDEGEIDQCEWVQK